MPPESWKKRIDDISTEHPLVRENNADENIRRRLAALFLDTIPGLLEDFKKYADNRTGIAKTAHSIKGAAGFVNARRVWALAGELEFHAKTMTDEEIATFVLAIKEAFEETKPLL